MTVARAKSRAERIEQMSLYGVGRSELMRFLMARTGDMNEAEDLAQELWLKAQAATHRPVANGRAYLFRMAHNLIIDKARARRSRLDRDRAWLEAIGRKSTWAGETVDPGDNAEQLLLQREDQEALSSAISLLPDRAKQVLVLHKAHDLSHADIAHELGISKSAVEKHMAVALKYLRRALLD